jgi:hypothetical protein
METAEDAARRLTSAWDRPVRPFSTAAALIDWDEIDAVAICSPASRHHDHLILALNRGLHVLCEKPLVWSDHPDDVDHVARIIDCFWRGRRVLHCTTQWVEILDDLRDLRMGEPPEDSRCFEMELAPPLAGVAMLREAISHPASLLAAFGGSGCIEDAVARWSSNLDRVELRFTATRTKGPPIVAKISLAATSAQPRPAALVLDGRRIDREVVSIQPYRLRLRTAKQALEIDDPLRRSVGRFVKRCGLGYQSNFHDADHMLRTTMLTETLRMIAMRSA